MAKNGILFSRSISNLCYNSASKMLAKSRMELKMQSSMLNIVTLRAMEPEDHVLINQWRNDKELQSLSAGTFVFLLKREGLGGVQDRL